MRFPTLWLGLASIAYASQSVFSVYDDFLAFPQVSPISPQIQLSTANTHQYELVFSDAFILEDEAASRLQKASADTFAPSHTTSSAPQDEAFEPDQPPAELSRPTSPDSKPASPPDQPPTLYESMILKSRPYLCSIPSVSIPTQNDTSKAKDKAEEAAELARATDRGWELLKQMEGSC
ncbi:MAG: hypothetical protein Q9211_005492, partial [Gyalolechia sp. 1 TL-2023]